MSTEKLAALMGAGKFAKPLEDSAIRWGIVSGEDKARWLAQLWVESAGFTSVTEGVNYKPETLVRVFGTRNGLTPELAKRLVVSGPVSVFNFIYGGEWGRRNLGNTDAGDGWKFRGRSLIQITGRQNYKTLSNALYGDLRLLEKPQLVESPEGAAQAAGWFWMSRKCNGVTDIAALTRKINGGSNHLAERIAQTNRAYDLLHSLASGNGSGPR